MLRAATDNAAMYFVVDPDKEVSPQHAALLWRRLWELRDLAPVGAMVPAVVSSPCPLLPDEATGAVLVANLAQVPRDSAWVAQEIDLARYLRTDGGIRMSLLDAALRRSVENGERAHSARRWGSPAQQADGRLNRRLSIFVRGWGDVVAARGRDPALLSTLDELRGLAEHISGVLANTSRTLAIRDGHCPAIDVAGARVLDHGREMNALWRRAIDDNALRHRNLLTLSPWDIFPRGRCADLRYADLLPLLRHADSVSLRRDVGLAHWNAKQFRDFHDRIAALLRRSSDNTLIANQV